jgi:hypothetical protein
MNGMGYKNMINPSEFRQAEFAHSRTGINQYVMIEQERSGMQIATDSPAASQYSEFHFVFLS